MWRHRLPNAISALRLAAAPLLLCLAWEGARRGFLIGYVVALASDALDGFLARRLGSTSELGARLDSWGDLATYFTLPCAAWWLWPDVVRREIGFIAVALLAYIAPVALGWLRFGRLTSYHTVGAKVSGMLMGLAVPLLFAWEVTWPFRLATGVFALAEAEEMVITLILPRWHSNVPSVVHALRLRRNRVSRNCR
jgi:CDP-diacylglycerol--glycerol-3-phosphate 3-phosphatidyltransferase